MQDEGFYRNFDSRRAVVTLITLIRDAIHTGTIIIGAGGRSAR